jgi:DNA-binding FrmR family transcriptional regulator
MAYRPKNIQERILHRLKISKGHLEKVIKMVEDDVYCIDVIHQMQAVEAAIRETEGVVLENHLKTCTADAIRNGKKEEAVAEVMNVFIKSK